MTDKEMAIEIGELLLKYQVQIMALRQQIKHLGDTPWKVEVKDEFDSQPFSGVFFDRCLQLQRSFDEAKSDVPLIRVLHQNLVVRQK